MTTSERVLIVEDDPKLARLLARALGDSGVPADTAESGEEAIALVTTTIYSALVVDVMLPGIDGLEVCRRLRRGGLRCPVLVMSAREFDTGSVAAAGADAFVKKPFQLGGLSDRIRQLPPCHPPDGWSAGRSAPTLSLPATPEQSTPAETRLWRRHGAPSLRRTLARRRSPTDQ